jgi:hypothetical protein
MLLCYLLHVTDTSCFLAPQPGTASSAKQDEQRPKTYLAIELLKLLCSILQFAAQQCDVEAGAISFCVNFRSKVRDIGIQRNTTCHKTYDACVSKHHYYRLPVTHGQDDRLRRKEFRYATAATMTAKQGRLTLNAMISVGQTKVLSNENHTEFKGNNSCCPILQHLHNLHMQ